MATNDDLEPSAQWGQSVARVLESIRLPAPYDLDEFLFPSDHVEVARCTRDRERGMQDDSKHVKAKQMKWEVKHLQAYNAVGLDWPPAISDEKVTLPDVRRLPHAG